MFHGDHIEFIAHAVAGDHRAGNLCGLFDIIGRTGGNGAELQFFRRTSCGKGRNLVFKFRLGIQVMISFFYLHGIAERTGGTRDDCDLLYRCGVSLQSSDQRMTGFVIGDHLLFFIGEDGIFLLVARKDHFNAFLKVALGDCLPVFPDGPQGAFVDDVGKFCAAGAACHARNRIVINVGIGFYLGRMDFENIFPSLEVRQFHRYPAVKPSRTQ